MSSYQFSTAKLIALAVPLEDGKSQTLVAPSGIPGGVKNGTLKDSGIIQLGYNALFMGAITLAVIFTLVAGISFITSRGDSIKLASARRRLMFAIIGLVVVISAFVVVSLVIRFLGAKTNVFFLK